MKSILIITSTIDVTVDYIINKFSSNTHFYRLDTDKIELYSIQHSLESTIISCANWSINIENIDSIYYRKPRIPDLSKYEKSSHMFMCKEIFSLLQGVVECFDKRCLTRPSILRLSENKTYQLKLAKKTGFLLPDSLITNDSNAAMQFCTRNKSIIKPISSGRITNNSTITFMQTNIVDNNEIKNLQLCPSYFQEYIKKDYEIRVTIVDKKVFAVKIESTNKVDWRKSDSRNFYSSVTIPESLIEKCYELMNILKLNFGAFDFIVRNNNYYFLEVNPNGQWLWLEKELNLEISKEIVNYLKGGS